MRLIGELIRTAALAFLSFAVSIGIAVAKETRSPWLPSQAISTKHKSDADKAHPLVLAEIGGALDGVQATYVIEVGRKIAAQTVMPNALNDLKFTVLDSSVSNVFALPGGHIYLTRQLLAQMNDEAELAAILAHAIASIAIRNAKGMKDKSQLLGVSAALANGLGNTHGQPSKNERDLESLSREQIYAADDYGIILLSKAGYDPKAMARVLTLIGAQQSLDRRREGLPEGSLPDYARTHPDANQRAARASKMAAPATGNSSNQNQATLFAALDGMLYDDNPKLGVVEAQCFKQPSLKLQFCAPQGFLLKNETSGVTIGGLAGKALFSTRTYAGDLNEHVASIFRSTVGSQSQIENGAIQKTTINGIPAAFTSAEVQSQNGPKRVTVYAYEFAPKTAYHSIAISETSGNDPFSELYTSIRRLTIAESESVRPRSIKIITASASDTIQSLSEQMPYPDFKLERFQMLNGLTKSSKLFPGQMLKMIVKQ
jgi:predicted Zn-dependent protease